MRAPEHWRHEGWLPRLLAPLAAGWEAGGALRRLHARARRRAPVPSLCIGNLVVGGAGKTPVALDIAARLAGRGVAVHCLARGYGGRLGGPVRVDPARHTAADVGDEPLLLAEAAPTWVGRDRAAVADAAARAGAAALVLDDGFQNLTLEPDRALLVVDGEYGFGNGRLVPAGPLRERVARGLARADAVALLGADRAGVRARLAGLPVFEGEVAASAADLAGARVLAFAGIAQPEKLWRSLEAIGAEIVARRGFPDHHAYGAAECAALLDEAARLRAVPVTTAKDHVRLPPALRRAVRVLRVKVVWRDPGAVEAFLDGFCAR